MTDKPPLTVKTLSQIIAEEKNWRAQMDKVFEHDEMLGYITINAAYPYHIKLDRIPDPEALVYWVEHLTGKSWMAGELVGEFVRRVYAIKGWNLHRRHL